MSVPVLNFTEASRMAAGDLKTDLTGALLDLYQAVSPSLSKNSILADFVRPTYTGYAPAALPTPAGPYLDVNGDPVLILGSTTFLGPTGGAGPTVAGIVVYLPTGSPQDVVFGAVLDSPITLTDATRVAVVTIQMGPFGNGWVSTAGSTLP